MPHAFFVADSLHKLWGGNFARSRLFRRLFRGVASLPSRREPAKKPAAARIGCPTIRAGRRQSENHVALARIGCPVCSETQPG
jgi:hypothetical protein